MGFHLDIQSAPERRGSIGTPATGSWSTNPTPTMSGTYVGDTNKTLTFGVTTGGLIGTASTIVVNWSDGTESGFLNLGTDYGYAAADVVLVHEGVSVAFAAGTFVTAGSPTFTVSLVAGNALRPNHQIIEADAAPVDNIPTFSRQELDVSHVSWEGIEQRVRTAILRNVDVSVDFYDAANYDLAAYLEAERHLVTLGEDYDETTVFCWKGYRGTALLPLIGKAGTFARSGIGSFVDPRTGKVTHAASGTPRYPGGQLGPALEIGGGTTNLLTRSSAQSGTLYFTASSGAVSVAYDTNVLPPCNPDDANIPAAFRAGSLRVAFSSAVGLGANANSTDVTVVASTTYTVSCWLKGHGQVILTFRSGPASAANTRATTAVIDLTDTWTRYEATGATVGGEVVGDITITTGGTQAAVCWAWGWQLEAKPAATALVVTDGASGTRNAETLNFPVPIPGWAGTLGLWFCWPGDDGASTYSLLSGSGVAGAERFALFYNASASVLQWFTNTTGGSSLSGSVNLVAGTWYHVALTWEHESTDHDIARVMYLNGASLASDASQNWEPTFGTGIDIAPSLVGVTLLGLRVQNVRIDGEVKDATAVADWYARGTSETWISNLRNTYGRFYRLTNVSEAWRGAFAPDQILATASLVEAGREPDSLLVPA